jgi:DNA polymerase III subunit chi
MFYHLTRSPADAVVAMLLPRYLEQGWRVMVRSPDAGLLDRLDARLWAEPEDGFLPHGRDGAGREADQPVLLGPGPAGNGARALVLLPGAPLDPAEAGGMERVAVVFDGADAEETEAARVHWKTATAAGLPAQYWSEESGRWEKKRG